MTVFFHGSVAEYTNGDRNFGPSGCSSLKDLVDKLGEAYGEPFRAYLLGSETCLLLVNGTGAMMTGGLDTPLKQGDRIEILQFVDAG